MQKHRRHGFDPGRGNRNPFQDSLSENPKQRGAVSGLVHRVTKGWTQPSTQFVWSQISDISETKKSSEQCYASDFIQISPVTPLISFFNPRDAKWHFATMTLYLPSHVTGFWFPWFFMTLRGAVRCSAESPPLI